MMHIIYKKIIVDLEFVYKNTKGLKREEFETNEVLIDSSLFRLIQISESSDKISDTCKEIHPEIAWRAIKGMRNRIVHEYGRVDFGLVYSTMTEDVPMLLSNLKNVKL